MFPCPGLYLHGVIDANSMFPRMATLSSSRSVISFKGLLGYKPQQDDDVWESRVNEGPWGPDQPPLQRRPLRTDTNLPGGIIRAESKVNPSTEHLTHGVDDGISSLVQASFAVARREDVTTWSEVHGELRSAQLRLSHRAKYRSYISWGTMPRFMNSCSTTMVC